jgi:hypothetical protein
MSVRVKALGVKYLAAALAVAVFGLVGLDEAAVAEGKGGKGKADGLVRYHPHLKKALKGLHTAKNQLSEADHHFGGHRALALKLTEEAIIQVNRALEFREDGKGKGKGKG